MACISIFVFSNESCKFVFLTFVGVKNFPFSDMTPLVCSGNCIATSNIRQVGRCSKFETICFRIGAPYLMMRASPDGRRLEGNEQFEGYSIDLIDAISQILNFSYTFQLAPDKQYGSYNHKTKEWNGLIRQLLDRVSFQRAVPYFPMFPNSNHQVRVMRKVSRKNRATIIRLSNL